jgi:hypothetical protein
MNRNRKANHVALIGLGRFGLTKAGAPGNNEPGSGFGHSRNLWVAFIHWFRRPVNSVVRRYAQEQRIKK